MEKIQLDKIPDLLKSLYCSNSPKYKSSSANRKFNCKCETCKKWNTLRNFYRKNSNESYRINQLEASKAWRKLNPDAKRRSEARRRAAKFEKYSENEILKIYGTKCHICKTEIDLLANRSPGKIGWELSLHLDHVIPLSKGGSDTVDNVRPSHGVCNVKKGAKNNGTY